MSVRDKARALWARRSRVGLDDLLPVSAIGLGGSLLVVILATSWDGVFDMFSVILMSAACICVMTASKWMIPSATALAVVVTLVWFTPDKAMQTASLSMFFMVLLLLWRRYRREAMLFGIWYLGSLISLTIPYASTTQVINGIFLFGALMLSFATVGELLGRQSDTNRKLDEQRREELSEQRRAIARELHDTAVYSTTMVVMRAEAMKLKLTELKRFRESLRVPGEDIHDGRYSPEEVRLWQMVEEYQDHLNDDLDFIARTGRRATADLRSMLSVLRASEQVADEESRTSAERFIIPTLPLRDILLEETNKIRAAGVDVQVAVEGDLDSISDETNAGFAKIVTEICSNMVKHASRDSAVKVMIDVQDDLLEAAFVNGIAAGGSPMKDSVSHDGLGLVGMRERAESLGGTVEVSATESRWIVGVSLPARR
ncbi:MAG: hypothetical protein QM705_09250 [Ancrocorticia sp.]